MKYLNRIFLSFLMSWPALLGAQQFEPVWETPYNPMTFYVLSAEVGEVELQAGDEIGIFDIDSNSGTEICVGAGILTQTLSGEIYLEMIASMDDGSLPGASTGFTPGNDFVFKLYQQGLGQIEDVEYSFPYPGYDEVFTSQGNALIDLHGLVSAPDPFAPVWETPYNPMTFYLTQATLNGVNLVAGDQIGIFDIDPNTGFKICVGATTLLGPIVAGDYLEMIASMDDGSLPDTATGFTPGNTFIFKFISQDAVLVETVSYSFPWPGYDEVFTSQGNAIVALAATTVQLVEHTITFNAGWTGISSYLIPQNTDLTAVLAPISGEVEILQSQTAFYQPGNNLSTLSTWDYSLGYFIKTNQVSQLPLTGFYPDSKTVEIAPGWNLIPVLSETEVDIETLFAEDLSKVQILKEAIGLRVLWPEKNIDKLETLTPGKAYLLNANQEFLIEY